MLQAVIFDLGGVVLESPFLAFQQVERRQSLAPMSIARLIRHTGHTGAWAALERGELAAGEFFTRFEQEAIDFGFRLDARELMDEMGRVITVRPRVVEVIGGLRRRGLKTAALTNNYDLGDALYTTMSSLRDAFDVFVESCREGVRKPDERIYRIVCERLAATPAACVFLDDLGDNVKAARALGMQTVKVDDPDQALRELDAIVGL